MFTIYGENYLNDYTRSNFTMTFASLDDIFNYMKKISYNFTNKYENYFPTRGTSKDYSWCRRISCENKEHRYNCFWIYQINIDDGIVYSTGRYTNGEKYCSKSIEEWLKKCEQARTGVKPKFVEF